MVRVLLCILFLASAGCATYNYAQNVKTIAFSDDLSKGHSTGNVRGEDCTWHILGHHLGGVPTVDRAFSHIRKQTDGGSFSGSLGMKEGSGGEDLRYINNASTKKAGFDAVLFGKKCIVVTGVGYR